MKKNLINNCLVAAVLLVFCSELLATAASDYEAGVAAYKAGENEAAAVFFESAMKQGMDSVSLHYNLASSYYRLGRYEEAKKYFSLLNQTEAMRDIAQYHLGLIAIKQKDGALARRYFQSIVNSGKDKKLINLSEKHLEALGRKKQDRWKSALSFNLGHDDNISSVSGDSVLDQADTFYELLASTDLLLTGNRRNGWSTGASFYGIEYSDSDSNDQYHLSLGVKRSAVFQGWDTNSGLNLSKSTYGGDDFQSIARLDIIGRKPLDENQRIYLRYQAEEIRSDNSIYDYLQGWRQRARFEYRDFSNTSIKKLYYELELNNRGELVTSTDAYDYSPTRHTLRGVYTHVVNQRWWLTGDLSFRLSDYPVSSSIDREDRQWKLALTADYRFSRTLKLTTKLQATDNTSTVDRYNYDKSVLKVGLSKLF